MGKKGITHYYQAIETSTKLFSVCSLNENSIETIKRNTNGAVEMAHLRLRALATLTES